MTLSLSQSYTAVGANSTVSFLATGGSSPYTYSVVAGGAGGSIDATTGVYTAPVTLPTSPTQTLDIIQVLDSVSAAATGTVLVGNTLLLFCEIIQNQMGLDDGRVYLWDQKIFQPQDYDPYIAVSVPICKPFGNNTTYSTDNDGNYIATQAVNMMATVNIDIISRGPAARDRKEEIILALGSPYAESQMEKNSFYVGRLSTNFIDLSAVDGAAIPYRYRITCQIQYVVSKTAPVNYYGSFQEPTLVTDNP